MQNILSFLSISKKLFKRLLANNEMIKIIFNYFLFHQIFTQIYLKFIMEDLRKEIWVDLRKDQKLNQFFPEYSWKFNIVYLLSNSSYLNPLSCKLIKKKGLPIVLNQNGVFYPAGLMETTKKKIIKCLKFIT